MVKVAPDPAADGMLLTDLETPREGRRSRDEALAPAAAKPEASDRLSDRRPSMPYALSAKSVAMEKRRATLHAQVWHADPLLPDTLMGALALPPGRSKRAPRLEP